MYVLSCLYSRPASVTLSTFFKATASSKLYHETDSFRIGAVSWHSLGNAVVTHSLTIHTASLKCDKRLTYNPNEAQLFPDGLGVDLTHVNALVLLGEACDGEHPRLRLLRGRDTRVFGDDLRGHRQYCAAPGALIDPRHLQEGKGSIV